MSQIDPGNGGYDLSHYENDHGLLKDNAPSIGQQTGQQKTARKQPAEQKMPPELVRARPADTGSSGWSAGRVAACIFSAGISELLRLAWRGIMSCCSSARLAPAREPRTGAAGSVRPASAPGTDALKSSLLKALTDTAAFPDAYREAVDSVLDELRRKYGSKYVPEGKTLNEILNSVPSSVYAYTHYDVYMGVKDADHAVTPRELQDLVRRYFVRALNKAILTDMAETAAQEHGGLGGLSMASFVTNQLKAPGMLDRLNACGSLQDVQKLFRDMGLAGIIADCRAVLDRAVSDLRDVYGADALPDSMEGVMTLGDRSDSDTLRLMLQQQCNTRDKPIDAGWLDGQVRMFLRSVAQHGCISRVVEREAREMGLPVNARSVSALARAILADQGNREALSKALNPGDMAVIVGKAVRSILPAQKAAVEEIYGEFADRVQPEQRPLLRSYITGLSFAPADAKASRRAVEIMAGHMQNWKDFSGDEEEMRELNESYRKYFDDDLSILDDSSSDKTGYKDDIYNTLIADANRADYVINGSAIKTDDDAASRLVGRIKDLLPDPQDQRFLSKLINQRLQITWMTLTSNGVLGGGEPAADMPGIGSIPVMPEGQRTFLTGTDDVSATFDVTISDDKKTARVRATMVNSMHYLDGKTFSGSVPEFGAVRYTFDFTLSLSAHENGQGVTSCTIGQKFMTLEEARG